MKHINDNIYREINIGGVRCGDIGYDIGYDIGDNIKDNRAALNNIC